MKTLMNKKDRTGSEIELVVEEDQKIIDVGMAFIKLDKKDKPVAIDVKEIENGANVKVAEKYLYRVIGRDQTSETIYYCNVKGKPNFEYIKYEDFLDGLCNKGIIKIKEKIIYPNDALISEEEYEAVKKREKAMLKVLDIYSPTFIGLKSTSNKKELEKLAKYCDVPYKRFRSMINDYIQSGFKRYSIYNKNSKALEKKRDKYNYQVKPGRKCYIDVDDFDDDTKTKEVIPGIVVTPHIEKIFDKYIALYLKNRHLSFRDTFNQMNEDYFMDENPHSALSLLKPIDERPTFNQYSYYFYKNIGYEERKKEKLGEREFRNNHRKLLSDTTSSVLAPGDRVEIDAWEVPVSIIDDSRKMSLGKPVLYAMCDCKSKLVIAASLSFENNSYIGLTSLFLNMTMDKRSDYVDDDEILTSYNICNKSNLLPREIVTDRGSDFLSKGFEAALKRIHIVHKIAPAATGSYKGNIEQLFNQLNKSIKASLLNKGYITNDYGSKPHKDAVLTLTGISRIIHNTIVKRNIALFENYLPSKELIDNNVKLSPISLWEYYSKTTNSEPRRIHDPLSYAYDLMIEDKAKITRAGISYKGLSFDCPNDEILQDQYFYGKAKDIAIRKDPRDNTSIFYKRNGTIYKADLIMKLESNSSYAGLTWNTYDKYRAGMRKTNNKNSKYNENLSVLHNKAIKQVVSEEMNAKKGDNEVTRIRKNRNMAKLENTNQRSIKNMMGLDDETEDITLAYDDFNLNENFDSPDSEDAIVVDDYEELKESKQKKAKDKKRSSANERVCDEVDLSGDNDFFDALKDIY